jgi:hypothetical protein
MTNGVSRAISLLVLTCAAAVQPNNSLSSSAGGDDSGSTRGVLNAGAFVGMDWVEKVNSAARTLPNGGTIEVPDSIAGLATTTGTIPSNVSLEFTGSATFGFCQINLGKFAKIYNRDALLQMSSHGSGCIGINAVDGAILQTDDKLILDGLRVDCNGQPGSTGIVLGRSGSQYTMRNVSVQSCSTVGLLLDGGQFGEYYNVSLYNNQVGLKIYTVAGAGGGNSNTFYGLRAVHNTVGVLISESTSFGQGPNYFINANLLSNTVAGYAVFGKVGEALHIIGGTTEVNGGGPSTSTIDGRVIKRAAIYSNFAAVYVSQFYVAEATISPWAIIDNKSRLTLDNVYGYGNPAGTLVTSDASSKVFLQGVIDTTGAIQNVFAYPSTLSGGGHLKISGVPVVSLDEGIPNAYAGNAMAPAFEDIEGSASQGTETDRQMGPVRAVTHAAFQGSSKKNRANFGKLLAVPTKETSDMLLSILLKSSVNCTYAMEGVDIPNSAFQFPLLAGQWTRVVLYVGEQGAGSSFTLVGYPTDSSGPTVSFARLELLATETSRPGQHGYFGPVLATGAVNPGAARR